MPIYTVKGKRYNIPDDVVADFEKDMPDATQRYKVGEDFYNVPVSRKQAFLNKYTDAVLSDEPKTEKPAAQAASSPTPEETYAATGNGRDPESGLYTGGAGTQAEADSIFDANARRIREKYANQSDDITQGKAESKPYEYKPEVQDHIVNNIPGMFRNRTSSLMDKPLGDAAGLPEADWEGRKYNARIDAANRYLESDEFKQRQKKEVGNRVTELSSSVDSELKSIDQQIEDRQRAVRDTGWRPGMPSSRDDRTLAELRGQRSYLDEAGKLLEESRKIIDEAGKKDSPWYESLGRGVRDTAFDVDNWTMGVSDLIGNIRLNKVLEKADKVANNEPGVSLTPAEEKLLDAAVTNMAVTGYYSSDLSRAYKAGQMTGESLPFMLEMIANPISASGNATAKVLLKYGLKKAGSQLAKNMGKTIGAAAGMTATTGLPGVFAGGYDRMNGQINFGMDRDGKLTYQGREGAMGAVEAFGKSAASRFLENHSEMVFNAFNGLGDVFWKGIQKAVPGGVNNFIRKAANTKAGQLFREFKDNELMKEAARRSQFHGIFGEYVEEVYNNLANIPLGEMTTEQLVDLDQNIDTFLGLAPTSVVFGMLGLGSMTAERIEHRRKMNAAFGSMTESQRKMFAELERMSKENGNEDIRIFIKETMADPTLSKEQKRQEIEYAYDIAVNNAFDSVAEEQTAEQGENRSAAQAEGEQVFASGEPAAIRESVVREDVSRSRLEEVLPDVETVAALMNADDAGRAEILSSMDETTRERAKTFLRDHDRRQAVEDAIDDAHAPEVEAARGRVSEMTLHGRVTVVPLGKYGDATHTHGVVINGLDENGASTINGGLVMVVPLENGAGGPDFSSFDTMNAVAVSLDSNAETVHMEPDAVIETFLNSYQADVNALNQPPIVPGQSFVSVRSDGTPVNMQVQGMDDRGNWVVSVEGQKHPSVLPEDELLELMASAERAPIEAEYAAGDAAKEAEKSAVQKEVMSDKYSPEVASLKPELGEEIEVDGRRATVSGLTPDGLSVLYLSENGATIGADVVPMEAYYAYKQSLADAEKSGTDSQNEGAESVSETSGTESVQGESSSQNESAESVLESSDSGNVQSEKRPMNENEAAEFIFQMERNAVEAPEINLTPENWVAEFGEDGLVETPIGQVKFGQNQYVKLQQMGRRGKLGMIRPTLTDPDVIVEDKRPSKDGSEERDFSYVFVKAFTGKGGKRMYYFASVTIKKDGSEVVISNQEKSLNKISRLLQGGNVVWTNSLFSSHPTTRIKESVPLNDSNKPTSTDSQSAWLGINSSELSDNKDSEKNVQLQEREKKPFHEREKDDVFRELGEIYGEKMPHKVEVTAKALADDVKKAQKKLDDAQQKLDDAPIGRDFKQKEARDKAMAEFEEVKREADFWAEMNADIKSAQQAPGEDVAEEILSMEEPLTGEEFAAQMLANGNIKLLRDSFEEETGFGKEEAQKYFGLFASAGKGGVTIQEAGERLMEADRENGTNFFDQNDPNAGRNAIIEVLGMAKTKGELAGIISNNRAEQARKEQEAEFAAYEAWVEDNFHMSVQDYEAYEENIVRLLSEHSLSNEEFQEFMSTFVDEIINNENYGQQRIDSESEAGSQVLSGSQSLPTGRTERIEKGSEETDGGIVGENGSVSESASGSESIVTGEAAEEEIQSYREKIHSWLSEENLESATEMTREETFEKFGNSPEPIAYIPIKYLSIFGEDVTDNHLYCGKGYFIDHAANHHPEVDVNEYDLLQDVLSNPDAIKEVGNSIAFTKMHNKGFAVLVQLSNERGKIVLHKSMFWRDKGMPYKNKKDVEVKPLVGGRSTISPNDDSIAGRLLSALNGTTNVGNYLVPQKELDDFLSEISEIEDKNNLSVENKENQEDVANQIEKARKDVDLSPTEAQKEAGNYKKGHIKIDGYDITIENPKGGTRSGTDKNGKKWSITMNNDYGYIRGTEAVDGDHIDVFLSDNPTEGNVFVIDQTNEDGSFDESKVMYGFSSMGKARESYLSNYSEGWESRIMAITEVSKDEFKKWIDSSHRKTKAFSEYKSVNQYGPSIESSNASRMQDIENRLAEIEDRKIEISDLKARKGIGTMELSELLIEEKKLGIEQLDLEAEYSGLRAMNDESNAILEEEGSTLRFREVKEGREAVEKIASEYNVPLELFDYYESMMNLENLAGASQALIGIKNVIRKNIPSGKLSEFIPIYKNIRKEIFKSLGDLDELRSKIEAEAVEQANLMESARKRAEEDADKERVKAEKLAALSESDLDSEYFKALEEKKEDLAKDLINEAARRKGYIITDYKDTHSAPVSQVDRKDFTNIESLKNLQEDGFDVNVYAIANGISPQADDYFEKGKERVYMNEDKAGRESLDAIRSAISSAKEWDLSGKESHIPQIKVYRAVPKSIKGSLESEGQWVTPSRTYAQTHGEARFGEGKYRIIEQDVLVTELWWDGNDVREWGYDDGRSYVYKNVKNNKKLFDVVTRDNKNNIIPPSKRFDSRKSDIRFRFIGERGARNLDKAEEATTRLDNLAVAREMEAAEKDAKAIKMATGWERGADGKWRYEVKDYFDVDAMERFTRGAYGKTFGAKVSLERVLKDDDTLLTEYPQLKETSVKFQRLGDSWGVYYPESNEIAINTNFIREEREISDRLERQKELVEQWKKPEESKKIMDMIKVLELNPEEVLKDAEEKLVGIEGELEFFQNQMRERLETTIIHEVQHAIQHIEGFEYGGNVDSAKKEMASLVKELGLPSNSTLGMLKQGFNEGYATAEQVEKANMVAEKRGFKDIESYLNSLNPERFYNNLSGEVEARNAARRSRVMNVEEMREYLASETEDVAREDQIFLQNAMEEGQMMFQLSDKGRKIQNEVDKFTARYNSKEATVVEVSTMSDEDIRDMFNEDPNEVREAMNWGLTGGYDKKSGKIFIFADNQDLGDLEDTMYHENMHGFFHGNKMIGAFDEAVKDNTKKLRANLKGRGYSETEIPEEVFVIIVTDALKKQDFKNVDKYLPEEYKEEFYNKLTDFGYETGKRVSGQRSDGRGNDSENGPNGEESRSLAETDGEKKTKDGSSGKEQTGRKEGIISNVQEISRQLGVPVELVESVDVIPNAEAKKRIQNGANIKGWYENGKVYLYLPNAVSVPDACATVWHEVIGHKGLRSLFGKDFNTMLDNVYANASAEIKSAIDTMAKEEGISVREATEEYMADLAERGPATKAEKSLWEKIKSFFLDMLRKANVKLGFELTDNDLRYILWESEKKLRSSGRTLDVAKETVVRDKLGIGEFSKGIRYREKRPQIVREYDEVIASGRFKFQEAFQDSMLSVKVLMEKIEEVSGKKAQSFENAYTAENRLSSINKVDNERYIEEFLSPLMLEVKKLADKFGRKAVENYIYAKSGLERNDVLKTRDADRSFNEAMEELDEKLRKNEITDAQYDALKTNAEIKRSEDLSREQDYAGLRGLLFNSKIEELERQLDEGLISQSEFESKANELEEHEEDLESEYKTHAETIVGDFEKKAGDEAVKSLWDKINAATNETLKKDFESGMMDNETYVATKNMMKFYVPLRGWSDKTAEEVYDYSHTSSPIQQNQKQANGRWSQAQNPILSIAQMAQNSIVRGNRNKMKQRLFNFVVNRPTELATFREGWYVKDNVSGEYEIEYPDIKEDDTAKEIQQKLDAFEKRMQELEKNKLAFKGRLPFGSPFRVSKKQKSEHVVPVMINGREYGIYINGNPRAAQAMNGQTNPEATNVIIEWYEKIKRFHSAGLTSWNPDFMMANAVRDSIHSATMTFMDKGPLAAARFLKDIPKSVRTVRAEVFGKGAKDPEMKKYFEEFVKYGGETGYTAVHTLEDYKREYERIVSSLEGWHKQAGKARKKLSAIAEWMEQANRMFEDINRFNAYQSARKSGLGIEESVDAAKNITVNFNKKGAGFKTKGFWGSLAGLMNKWMLFFNPTVQGITQILRSKKSNPKRFSSIIGSTLALGVLMPFLNEMIVGDEGGDDDYWNQNDYNRMNNLLLYTPIVGGYIKIPLPPTFREIYGLGDILYRLVTGRITPEKAAVATLRQLQLMTGFINIIPDEEPDLGKALTGLAPDVLSPFTDVIINQDFTGRKIAKVADYNKQDPEYKRVYKGVSPLYVELSRYINKLGGDDISRAPLLGTFINPAYMEHVVTGYTGGIGKTISNITGLAVDLASGDLSENFDMRKVPVVSRFYQPSDDVTVKSAVNRKFREYESRYEKLLHDYKGYKNAVKEGRPEFQSELDRISQSGEKAFMDYFKSKQKVLKKKQEKLKKDPENNLLEMEILELKAEISAKCREILMK